MAVENPVSAGAGARELSRYAIRHRPRVSVVIVEGIDGRRRYIVEEPRLSARAQRVLDEVSRRIVRDVALLDRISRVIDFEIGLTIASEIVRGIVGGSPLAKLAYGWSRFWEWVYRGLCERSLSPGLYRALSRVPGPGGGRAPLVLPGSRLALARLLWTFGEAKSRVCDAVRRYLVERFSGLKDEDVEAIAYYIARDFVGYGRIDPLIRDKFVEDISCNGVNEPVYVFHRDYEWLETNVIFNEPRDLERVVSKLALRCGQEISIARPVIEGVIKPEGYRVNLVLDVVSRRGHSFTIRKFRAEPFTIIELIRKKTMNALVAAYLWMAIDYKQGVVIYGPTGSGKTTLMNALALLLPPEYKIVCVAPGTRLATNGLPRIENVYGMESLERVEENNIETKKIMPMKILVFNSGHLKQDFFSKVHKIRVPSSVKLVKITTEFGAYVTVTPNTRIPVFTEDGIVYKKAVELKPGDVIPQIAKLDVDVYEPPVAEVLGKHGFRVKLNKPVRDDKGRELYSIPVYEYLDRKHEGLIEAVGLWLKGGKHTLKVPVDKLPDPAMSYIAGFVAGDGSIHHDRETVVIAQKNEEMLKHLMGLCLRFIDRVGYAKSSREIILPPVFGRYLRALYGVPAGKKAGKIRIPSWLYHAPIEHVKAFLAGLVDSVGSVGTGVIEFTSVSREFIEDIVLLALRLGVIAKVIKTFNKKGEETWCLWRARYEGEHAGKLAEALASYSIKIRSRFGRVHRYMENGTYLLPVVIGRFLSRLAEKRGVSKNAVYKLLRQHVLEPEKAPRPRIHVNKKELFKAAELLGLKGVVENILDERIAWVYVEDVEQIDHEGIVYDVTPSKSRYFIAGNMGLLVVEDTAEDTPEIMLPFHDNWMAMVTRLSNDPSVQSVTLQAQVEAALRQRPDVIILGEIRSREAYSFFQAVSTGHGGLTTVHAEDTETLINRLAAPPMNVPKSVIASVKAFVFIARLSTPQGFVRKVIKIDEGAGYEPEHDRVVLNPIIRWDRHRDTWYMTSKKSALMRAISEMTGLSYEEVFEDLVRRATVINWAATRGFDLVMFHTVIRRYSRDPDGVFKEALREAGLYKIEVREREEALEARAR